MDRAKKWLTRGALMLAVVVAMGFDTRVSKACAQCEFDPPIMGPCTTTPECQGMCDDFYEPGETTGVCSQNCCVCLF